MTKKSRFSDWTAKNVKMTQRKGSRRPKLAELREWDAAKASNKRGTVVKR